MPSRLSALRVLTRPLAGDRELMRAYVEAGDTDAFADLARRYHNLARRVAADICPHAADDVAQSTVTLLGRKIKLVAQRESAAGWVFETARRLARKARTAAARRARHESKVSPLNRSARWTRERFSKACRPATIHWRVMRRRP